MRALPLALALLLGGCGPSQPPPEPAPLQFDTVAGATTEQRGERLGRVLGCTGCHGTDLTGHSWIDDPNVAILFTANLTRAMPGYSDVELARAIRWGIRPDRSPLWDMPSDIFTHLSEPDMAALIAWLRTVPPNGEPHPRIRIGPEWRRAIERGEVKPAPLVAREHREIWPPQVPGNHELARYMVRATCSECHGLELGGHADDPDPAYRPPDLIVVGAYSRAEFRHLMRTGEPTGGRRLGLMREVALGRFAHLTDREVDAIYDYLIARSRLPR